MCGIAGIVGGRDPERIECLRGMTSVMAHRGPDDEGMEVAPSGRAALGFRRLSIIDLEGGNQPMANETGDILLVCNGEIYNFRELRRELERRGHRFRSRSDAEVALHLYEERGVDALSSLEGMFALAIWDDRKGTLLLARDRMGKKPLVWWRGEEGFLFASEIKALLKHPDVPREWDPEALPYYLTYMYLPAPRTMFRGIRKLPPAHWLVFRGGKIETGRYWNPVSAPPERMTEREAADAVFGTLSRAVERRLVSDVPVGAFLSGGIDSTIVTGLMGHHRKEPVRTFSIGFGESAYDETEHARTVSRFFRTDHTAFTVRPEGLKVLPGLIWQYDEPFADSSAIPTMAVSRETAKHVKVALSGDGGDETFGGYERYGLMRRMEPFRFFPTAGRMAALAAGVVRQSRKIHRIRRLLRLLGRPAMERYRELMSFFPVDEHGVLLEKPGTGGLVREEIEGPFHRAGGDPVRSARYADFHAYLPGDILRKVDAASMAHSLEVRSPFLDREVVELSLRIPERHLLSGGVLKGLLRRTFRGMLPASILKRGKMGFGVPLPAWFRGPLKPLLENIVGSERALARGIFRPEEVLRIIGAHLSGRSDYGHQLWILLCLELWFRTWIDPETPAVVSLEEEAKA